MVLGLAAVNSGHNLLYLIFSTMLAMTLISGNVAFANLRGIVLQRHYPSEFHAGTPVLARLEARNAKRWLASYGLRVDDYLIPEDPSGGEAEPVRLAGFIPIVRSGQSASCRMPLVAPARGVYSLPFARISSCHPFGFFRRARRIAMPGKLLVFPKLLPSSVVTPSLGGMLGGQDSGRKGQGAGLYGLRNYQSGDPARLIHWKHSAKGQGLKLKEFEEEWAQACRVMMDLRTTLPMTDAGREQFEKAISVAATLARYLIERHCSVAFWTTMGRVPMGVGRNQLLRVLRAMARLAAQPWDARLPPLEPDSAEIPSLWVLFQDPDAMPAGVGPSIPRGARARLIDARKIQAPALAR
jgi:uncharacterized protein (DUF58 family)